MLKVNVTQLYNILAREPSTPKQFQKQLWTHFEIYANVCCSSEKFNCCKSNYCSYLFLTGGYLKWTLDKDNFITDC